MYQLIPKKVIKYKDIIRTARKRKGLRQADMADLMCITMQQYCRMERGVSAMSVDSLLKICEILKLKLTIE